MALLVDDSSLYFRSHGSIRGRLKELGLKDVQIGRPYYNVIDIDGLGREELALGIGFRYVFISYNGHVSLEEVGRIEEYAKSDFRSVINVRVKR